MILSIMKYLQRLNKSCYQAFTSPRAQVPSIKRPKFESKRKKKSFLKEMLSKAKKKKQRGSNCVYSFLVEKKKGKNKARSAVHHGV